MSLAKITTPDDPALADLCAELSARADATDAIGDWPGEQLRLCGEAGVFEWFLDGEWGGQGWSDVDVVRGYLALSAACLTTTFIITQRTGACRRIASGSNDPLKRELLPALAAGDLFSTVGISHLTTSRRHLATPVLRATPTDEGYQLDGFSPWVTGAAAADWILTGATVMEGDQATAEQILVVVPRNTRGLSVPKHEQLVALAASQTGRVEFGGFEVPREWLVDGPVENVIMAGRASRPGGHETSTLAVGLATAALDFLAREAEKRDDLKPPHDALRHELDDLRSDLLATAAGAPVCSSESLRGRANSLVLRSTQATLAAAKGSGYVVGHPAGRWCREALFFLVWSCPQPVMNANLCELAGIEG
jgi:alkylation response protein AidB-like acyl-CoA dehydrogenase